MKEQVKNYMGGAIIIALLVLSYAAVKYVGTYDKSIEPSTFRSFSASGEGKVVAIPDIAQFSFSVVTEGGLDIGKSQEDNVNKSNAIIDFFKSNGIDAKDIKTTGFNINPKYEYYSCPSRYTYDSSATPVPCPPPKIVGYTITQSVTIKVRKMDKAGEMLSGAVDRGANNVSGLSFTVDEPDKYQNQAREEAIAKAKEKAKAVAKAGGFGVGRLLGIEEGGYQPYYDRYYGMAGDMKAMEASAPAPAPSIEPGSQEITVNVTLRYEIR
jgi:hypothetical protein